MLQLLKTYLKKLTNLTSRNRSLLLLNLPIRHFIDLRELDFAIDKSASQIISEVLEQKKTIALVQVFDPRNERSNKLSKQLAQIAKTQNTILEERGAQDLYLGYPIVKGKLIDGTVVRAPLLFFPFELVKSNLKKETYWCLEKTESEPIFNRSLLLAYSHFNKVKIEDELLDFSFDAFPKNSLEFKTELYETLKNSGLAINFNQDNFKDQLDFFEKYSKADLEAIEKIGELKLFPQAVLGIFPQGGSYLVNDFEELIENIGEEVSPEVFFEQKQSEPLSIKEADNIFPFEIDASQELALKKIKSGQSLVVQGPPGTGKSQLISNLISDYISNGKRVLLVCQKRAALDTVYNRLKSKEIENSLALIHDFRNDRKELFAKVSDQIERIEEQRIKSQSLNAAVLNREFAQLARKIDSIESELDTFKSALFDTNFMGKSVKDLYLLTQKHEISSFPEAKSSLFLNFKFDEFDEFINKYKQWKYYETRLSEDSNACEFWSKRSSLAKFDFLKKANLETQLNEVKSILSEFDEIQISTDSKLENFGKLNQKNEFINSENVSRILSKNESSAFEKIRKSEFVSLNENQIKEFKESILKVENILSNPKSSNFEYKKDREESKLVISTISKYKTGKFPNFNYQLKRTLGIEKMDLLDLLIQNGLNKDYGGLIDLEELYHTKILIYETLNNDFFEQSNLPVNDYIKFKKDQIWAAEFYNYLSKYPNILKLPISKIQSYYISKIELQNKAAKLKSEESPIDFKEISSKNIDAIITYLKANFDILQASDEVFESFNDIEQKLALAAINTDNLLYNYYITWINRIENSEPILRLVSTGKMELLESELQEAISKKQELSTSILQLKLYERATENLEINRLKNRVSYRELYHQTTKKRRLYSIRKLIENHQEELFKLLPCWMASPEAVSSIFPLNIQFDLVIFDEASQCYAEHALPSLMRAKQVVVAGDNKQLTPNDLYQIRYEEENYENELSEIDSFLDLCSQFYPNTLLTGHYRSKHPALIEFSNRHFYKSKLQLLPDYKVVSSDENALEFIKVDGVWENNQNEIEAIKVIEILKSQEANKSIGIVTFNFKQAELIQSLVDKENNLQSLIQVKNIENIQGDEFDIVIFSIAYAKNVEGKLLMNFGTLANKGGENRLNVAISRAKEKIFLVSSVLAEDLQIENSLNQGPKLLKAYLKYVKEVSNGEFKAQKPKSDFATDNSLKEFLKMANNQTLTGEMTEEFPFTDLVQIINNQYQSLILTDDNLYFDALSSKESHGYLPMILSQKGWNFKKYWSRNYLNT